MAFAVFALTGRTLPATARGPWPAEPATGVARTAALAVVAMEVVHPRLGVEAGVVRPDQLAREPRMNVHKNARMTVHGRLLLVQRVRDAGWRVIEAATAAGVSERTAHTWLAR